LAEPGGICITSIVNESIDGGVNAVFTDAGKVSVKNIDRRIHVWKWRPSDTSNARVQEVAGEQPPSKAPSIAVLPFTNMSGDTEQDYFSDGITDDILTDLSKLRGLLVIARNSTFAYKGKNVDIRTIGRELGVGCVLEGSIRRVANRVRITAQLIDAGTGGHLWAERYDRDLTDIFAVQDDVTRKIIDALRIALSPGEKARLASSGTTSLEAHDLYLRGRELLLGPNKDRPFFERTRDLFQRAIECDPNYADPYAGLAWLHELNHHNHWSSDPDQSLQVAARFADQAIEKGPKEPFPHYVAGVVALFSGNLGRARAEAETALALSPNYALAYSVRCIAELYNGDPLAAIPWMERAIRLDPGFSHQYLHFLGTAYLTAAKYETAAALFKERILLAPGTDLSRAFLAAALGHLGEIGEARRVWDELMTINPKYSFTKHIGRLPFKIKEDAHRIAEGLNKAGLAN
jgi:adenylate cyclase